MNEEAISMTVCEQAGAGAAVVVVAAASEWSEG